MADISLADLDIHYVFFVLSYITSPLAYRRQLQNVAEMVQEEQIGPIVVASVPFLA